MREQEARIKRVVPWILVVLLVAVSGYQLASAKSRTARIHGCIDKRTRVVHIVGSHQTCSHRQYSRYWNIRGPQGRPGPPGPAAAEKFGTQSVCVDAKGNLSMASTATSDSSTTTASSIAILGDKPPKGDKEEGDGDKPPKDDKGNKDEGDGDKPPKDDKGDKDKGDKGKDCVAVLTVLTPSATATA